MKFRFGFEKVLQHKRNVEDAARRDLNAAQARLQDVQNEVSAMYKAIDDSRVRANDLATLRSENRDDGKAGTSRLVNFSPVTSLVQIDDFIRGQGVRIEQHKLKVREHMAIVEEAQEVLLEAAKERKIYEKLRERRLEEFKDAEKKRELKLVDDMVVTRYKVKEG